MQKIINSVNSVYVLLHVYYVIVRKCNLHNPHYSGHIENYKQHTADLQAVALFFSCLVLVQLSGPQTQAGWRCVLLGSDACNELFPHNICLLRFGL